MSIYLLEVFENSTIDIPDFGLAFNNIDILLEFVGKKSQKITPDAIEFAKELKEPGVGFFLDQEETIRVTIIPLVKESSEKTYNNLFTIALKEHAAEDKEHGPEGKDHKNTNEEKELNNNEQEEEEEETIFKNSPEILEVEKGTENAISDEVLKEGNTVVDFHDLINSHSDPKLYIKKETFDKLPKLKNKVKDPYTQVPINVATTHKIKIKRSKNTTKKNISKKLLPSPVKSVRT